MRYKEDIKKQALSMMAEVGVTKTHEELKIPKVTLYNWLRATDAAKGTSFEAGNHNVGDVKTILCFGDSNTHGDRPDAPGRFGWHERWTGLLQQRLGDSYHVIEEGLNGRTTVWEDEIEGDKSGKKQLPSCIMSHAPVDVLILMLGTNDFKRKFSLTPTDIAWAIEALIKIALTTDNEREQPPKILLAAPTYLGEKTFLGEIIGNRKEDSLRLGGLLQELAERYNIGFINIAEVAGPSELDGMHFDAEGHQKVAAAMEEAIRAML